MAKLYFVHMPVRAPVHKGEDLLYTGVVVVGENISVSPHLESWIARTE